MRLKPQTTVLIAVGVVIAGVLLSMALGWWQTESDKTPRRLETTGQAEGTAAYNPADIKGSFTFEEVSRLYEIPLDDLTAAFGVDPGKAATFKVKDLESLFTDPASDIGTASLRLFAAWYKGLPFERKEDSLLPARAAQILQEKAALDADQLSYLAEHTYTAP